MMNKDELARTISKRLEITNKDGMKITNAVFAVIRETLGKGHQVSMRGFGLWGLRSSSERKHRNPKTGQPVMIPARKRVYFRPGKDLKKEVAK